MTVYAIAQSRTLDQAQLDRYIEASSPTLAKYGARVLGFDESAKIVEGENEFPRTFIMAFDSEADFYRWYDSEEYTQARKLREHAALGRFFLVNGVDI